MMDTVQIRRFATTYRLRPSQLQERARLDRLVPQLLGEPLELALERAGIGSGELVCIRRIRLPIRLRLSRSDSELLTAWALELAQAVASGAAEGLRYSSRPLALIEMGTHLSERRFHNAWAWRQLGFWRLPALDTPSPSVAAAEFAATLEREPDLALAVLIALARKGSLRPILQHMRDGLVDVAASVLARAGQPASAIEEVLLNSRTAARQHRRPGRLSYGDCGTARSLRDRAYLGVRRALRCPHRRSTALYLIASLECEPSLALATPSVILESIRAIHLLSLLGAATIPGAPDRFKIGAAASPDAPSDEPEHARPSFSEKAPELHPEFHDTDAPLSPATPLPDFPTGDVPVLSLTPRPEPLTAFGGLLFLLRMLDRLDMPRRMMATLIAAERGLRWMLHQLALALQPLAPDDLAALAFCGLPPEAPPPSEEAPRPSPEEQSILEAFAGEIRASLAEAIADAPGEPRLPERTLQFVCRRYARVVADPGWIELRFALQDVSTPIRAAGLDLDPNYVPWLGVVIRFVYE